VVVISWTERQELLERLRKVEDAEGLVGRFEAVGASRPVELGPGVVLADERPARSLVVNRSRNGARRGRRLR
jgi:hypothetical protein